MPQQQLLVVHLPRRGGQPVRLPATADVKATFGPDAFLVRRDESSHVVPLLADGCVDWAATTQDPPGDAHEHATTTTAELHVDLVYGQTSVYDAQARVALRQMDGEMRGLRRDVVRLMDMLRAFERQHLRQLDVIKTVAQVGVDDSSVKRAIRKAHFDFHVPEDALAPTAHHAATAGPERIGSPSSAVFTPIGYIESVFVTKNGTPRQGFACSTARARLTIAVGANSSHFVEGLEEYSHLWLLFLFHDNGGGIGLRPKVVPPMRDGERTGVFATRAPHRPNPIGLSLCRLDSVDGATLHLSAIDLIHGTPILDIKPYVPRWDSVDPATTECRVAHWVQNPRVVPLHVNWSKEALEAAHSLQDQPNSLRLFKSPDELIAAVSDILRSDPRSIRRRQQHNDQAEDSDTGTSSLYRFALDNVDVVCRFSTDDSVTVTAIERLQVSLDIVVVGINRLQAAPSPTEH